MFKRLNKEARAIEEVLYTRVADEIERNDIKKGLWMKAVAETAGDKPTAEALYIKLRVQNLIDQLRKEEHNLAKINREEAKRRCSKELLYSNMHSLRL